MLDDLMIYARNCIMLIKAKCDKDVLKDSMPEATSQAIALSEATGCVFNTFAFDITNSCVSSNKTVRYCLSDGNGWIFLVYTCDDQGNHISYEGPVLRMMPPHNDAFEKDDRCLVAVLYHWVCLAPNVES